jgi:hypothetical protein
MRAQMEKGMEQLKSSGGLPISDDSCQWSEADLSVVKTGDKAKFAGVKAVQHIIRVNQTCTDPETGRSCDVTWTLENWLARRMPGDDEVLDFQKTLAEKLGGDELMGRAQGMSYGLMTMFKDGWDEILDEADDMKGYPIKTVMQFAMGGESCTMAGGQTIAMDEMWGNAGDAAVNASMGTAASHAGSAIGQEASDALGNSVGGSIAGSAIGAASREVIGGMFNKFKKKKKEPEPTAAELNPSSAPVTIFRVSTEITQINEESVSPGRFEVPAGWKKVKAPSY